MEGQTVRQMEEGKNRYGVLVGSESASRATLSHVTINKPNPLDIIIVGKITTRNSIDAQIILISI